MNARLSSLLLVLALGLTGCVDHLVPVEFYGFCGYPKAAAVCDPPGGKCATYQNGQLYLYYENWDALDMYAEFQNQRPNNEGSTPGGVNTANAMITEYRYKFSASPPVALASRTVPYLSTPIGSGGSSTVWLSVLPPETVAELRATLGYQGFISVEITPRGRFGDGSTFEVGSITVPVWVYTGGPPPTTCPDPAAKLSFCPSEFQTHTYSCGGTTSTGDFVISGTISGLTSSGLVLASPGLVNLPVPSGSTTFAFVTTVADGTAYDVTIQTQPSGQTCTVTSGGSGTVAGADVTGIQITCN